jgi:hypothetical protein
MAFWSALRRWGERAVAAGMLTVADLRNGAAEACTLLSSCISPVAISPAQTPTGIPLALHPGEPEALPGELLAVPSEGWRALAVAMSEERSAGSSAGAGRLAKDRAQVVSCAR